MTDGDLDALETLDREATPGPWDVGSSQTDVLERPADLALAPAVVADCYTVEGPGELEVAKSNADLIAAMRNALPALLADSRALAAYRTREQQARALIARVRRLRPMCVECDEYRNGDMVPIADLEAIYAKEAES